jgi:hypothetical protein
MRARGRSEQDKPESGGSKMVQMSHCCLLEDQEPAPQSNRFLRNPSGTAMLDILGQRLPICDSGPDFARGAALWIAAPVRRRPLSRIVGILSRRIKQVVWNWRNVTSRAVPKARNSGDVIDPRSR